MASADENERRHKTPNHLRTLHEKDQAKRLIIVLEDASLEVIKVSPHASS